MGDIYLEFTIANIADFEKHTCPQDFRLVVDIDQQTVSRSLAMKLGRV